MGRTYDRIDDRMAAFLGRQAVFFVATAPLGEDGHVNVSPKGVSGTFAVLDPLTVGYLDLTGSGVETIAHLRENGRITLMFCAFEGPPRIVRLYGRGRVVTPTDADFEGLAGHFPDMPGGRAVIVVDINRIADSCGYGVPEMGLTAEREQLSHFYHQKGDESALVAYRRENNSRSIDGLDLDGLPPAQ